MNRIIADKLPTSTGPFVHATVANGLVFVSGQQGVDPVSGAVAEDVGTQTRATLSNLEIALKAAGSGLDGVLKTTVYLTDMDKFGEMNTVYANVFGDNAPARTAVAVSALPGGVAVEIEAIAEVSG